MKELKFEIWTCLLGQCLNKMNDHPTGKILGPHPEQFLGPHPEQLEQVVRIGISLWKQTISSKQTEDN